MNQVDIPRLCAVVDAQGTGRFLPAALAEYGTGCVHVRSANPDIHIPIDQHGIALEVRHAGNLDQTAAALRELGVDHVIAGAESGVELADLLARRLGVPGNGMQNPQARRNKHEMVKAVRRAGLASIAAYASGRTEDVIAWANIRDRWPVVLKPTESAGADNVFFCFSENEISNACARILADTDRYGRRNRVVLAEEFIDGEEYYVNTVTRNRTHHVSEIWHYHKKWDNNRIVYDYEHPVPADKAEAAAVGEYTLAVLDALEIHNGAAHTEVMNTARGPVLVECGARLCGSLLPSVVSRCFGTNHVELTALSIARPHEFLRFAGEPYRLGTHVRYVSLINPRRGAVPGDAACAQIRALPSFAEMALTRPAGTVLPRTVDMLTSPGFVYLMSDDPRQVRDDYRLLRDLEQGALYDTANVAGGVK